MTLPNLAPSPLPLPLMHVSAVEGMHHPESAVLCYDPPSLKKALSKALRDANTFGPFEILLAPSIQNPFEVTLLDWKQIRSILQAYIQKTETPKHKFFKLPPATRSLAIAHLAQAACIKAEAWAIEGALLPVPSASETETGRKKSKSI